MTKGLGDGKELLIVSFSYFPIENPRSFRWTSLAEEFVNRGVHVRVVCAWQPGLLEYENINGVEVHRVGNRLLERLRKTLSNLRGQKLTDPDSTKRTGTRLSFSLVFSRWSSWLWRFIAWPDTSCVWYAAALLKASALIKNNPQMTLVTVTPSFTSALVGLALTRKMKTIRWILDMGDPFTLAVESPANNFYVYGKLNKWIEKIIFTKANFITITNNEIQNSYSSLYPAQAKNFLVIPPLISLTPTLTLSSGINKNIHKSVINIVYVGSLYRSLRRPHFLLSLFQDLVNVHQDNRIELHFFGDINECLNEFHTYKNELGEKINLHGKVSREEALLAIHDADIVVNLGNSNRGQVPSKLVEYMYFGKPIINIIQDAADPSLVILSGYHHVLTIHSATCHPTSEQLIACKNFIEHYSNSDHIAYDNFAVSQFLPDTIADRYSEVLFVN
jgi:glycosyltransferase involved in cell wall biosynthesis